MISITSFGLSVFISIGLKQGVNEWCKGRSSPEYKQNANQQENNDDGGEPPFFPVLQKEP
jgi:hypothetical protein